MSLLEEDAARTPGRFVVLEGPDGGGKTTQVARLGQWLGSTEREVVLCRDPGGTALGDRLRTLVKDQTEVTIGMRAEMLLFMASRAQMVEDVIRPAMARGAVVVGDRFLLSNVVYQGYAGGLDVAELWSVGRAATAGLMPDLTVVLDVPPGLARERIGPGRDRIEDRGEGYRHKVRQGYLDAVSGYPGAVVVVDGSADVETVAFRVRSEVERALAFPPRS